MKTLRGSGGQASMYLQSTWDEVSQRTVTVWVDQTRASSGNERRIMMSAGYVNDSTLSLGIDAGVRTHVAPGVACGGYFSAGYFDCIMAYVPLDETDTGRIRVRRFWIGSNSTNFYPVWDPTTYILPSFGGETAGSISAYYHDGNYYLSFRSQNPGQWTHVMKSANGQTWTFDGLLDQTLMPPSAISHWDGSQSNYITQWVDP